MEKTLQDTKFDSKLDLVIDLLNDHDINIFKVIDTYEDSKLVKKILGLDSTMSEADMIQLENKLIGNEHHKDYRTTLQFARNLVMNWLIEDFVYYMLRKQDIEVKRTGKDGHRKLLKGWNASSDPDLQCKINNNNLWIEVIANYPTQSFDSFWESEGYYDLRDYKLKNLKSKSYKDKTIVLGVNVKQKKYFTMQITPDLQSLDYSPEEKFGNKLTKKVMFPGGKPTLTDFSKLHYSVRNMLRQIAYHPLTEGKEMESLITQYFETQRGFCVATQNTDKNLIHVKTKVVTDEAQIYYVYYQEGKNSSEIEIPVDHIMNDYDYGFQFSFDNKSKLYCWEGSVLKHYIQYNLKDKKVWEAYLNKDRDTLILPAKYVPNIKEIKLSQKFQEIL
jgi:hypothetical protein